MLYYFRYLIERTASSDVDRYFKVDPVNGEVKTQKTLDRETLEVHTVKILAVDNGNKKYLYSLLTSVSLLFSLLKVLQLRKVYQD